eukprot:scaffold397_cov152-Isochrysis_galbana.AAC.3
MIDDRRSCTIDDTHNNITRAGGPERPPTPTQLQLQLQTTGSRQQAGRWAAQTKEDARCLKFPKYPMRPCPCILHVHACTPPRKEREEDIKVASASSETSVSGVGRSLFGQRCVPAAGESVEGGFLCHCSQRAHLGAQEGSSLIQRLLRLRHQREEGVPGVQDAAVLPQPRHAARACQPRPQSPCVVEQHLLFPHVDEDGWQARKRLRRSKQRRGDGSSGRVSCIGSCHRQESVPLQNGIQAGVGYVRRSGACQVDPRRGKHCRHRHALARGRAGLKHPQRERASRRLGKESQPRRDGDTGGGHDAVLGHVVDGLGEVIER